MDLELHHAKEKQQYRISTEIISQIIKNTARKKDFELYMVDSDCFVFADKSTRDEIGDGFILFKIILDDIKPSNVIDMQDFEEKLTSATLQKYGNNILSCKMDMEKLNKEFIRLNPKAYDNNRFLTQLFCALETTTTDSFKRAVEGVEAKLILGDAICMFAYVIKTCNTK